MIIIPDIHGRVFWKKPVEGNLGKEHIIFLGDYVDPYEYEGFTPSEALRSFETIVEIKRSHPEDVTLLLGNHDLHYVDGNIMGARYDFLRGASLKRLILNDDSMFQMAYETTAGGKKILFTHAGVLWGWVEMHADLFDTNKPDEVGNILNALWSKAKTRPFLTMALADVSKERWGNSAYGSPIWSDVADIGDSTYELPGIYQIFGHSQQEFGPVITEYFACLDCRRAFRLADDGKIVDA